MGNKNSKNNHNNNIYTTIKITITKEYKLLIEIDSKYKEEINPCISFNGNFISIGNENENDKTIHFMQEWIENPEEYRLYSIHYFNKEYQVVAEVLFAIIMKDFKERIEKEFIIEEVFVEIPSNNHQLAERIKISLESIDLKNITINFIDFDYSEQGEYLHEILEKKEAIEKRRKIIEKTNEYAKKMEIEEIEMNESQMETSQDFENELMKKFTFEQRNAMNLCSFDNYCIFIASRYFDSLDDHINLIRVCKRMRGNMEKFHYNPISVDSKSVKLFPNVESLHLYDERDEYLSGGRIERYVNWRKISFYDSEQVKRINKGKEIEFKKIVWTEDDTEIEYYKQKSKNDWEFKLTIPQEVNEIEENYFDDYSDNLNQLIIPTTVKTIPKNCIEKCNELTNITFPLNESQMIIGNKIFSTPHFEQYIYLPENIQIINGNEVDRSKMEIPTTVTSLDGNCFYRCYELNELTIPETVCNIPMKTFMKLPQFEELIIKSSKYELNGNRLFYIENYCLHSIHLPTSTWKVNNQDIKPLKTFTIPTKVTKISDYCFANCEELTEIKGLENIKELGKGCFYRCNKLNQEEYPEVQKNIEEYLNEIVKKEYQEQLNEWTSLKCSEILLDSDVDNWSENTSVLNERIIGKKQLTFIIEDEDNEIFGYYLNTEIIEEYDVKQKTDSKTFHFNLLSKNNRLTHPMKFEIKDLFYGGIHLFEKLSDELIWFGDICLKKEDYKNESNCNQDEYNFDYHGIQNALCGKYYYTPNRIIVIQMK